jgi:hypothetical protein
VPCAPRVLSTTGRSLVAVEACVEDLLDNDEPSGRSPPRATGPGSLCRGRWPADRWARPCFPRDASHSPNLVRFRAFYYAGEAPHRRLLPQWQPPPFGLCPWLCIGQNLALFEAKVTLAVLLRRFELGRSPRYTGVADSREQSKREENNQDSTNKKKRVEEDCSVQAFWPASCLLLGMPSSHR